MPTRIDRIDVGGVSRRVAGALVAASPRRYIATMSKAARSERIFIDYLRNSRASTSVAAYSIRAREGAPVSLPLRWEELDGARPVDLRVAAVLERAGSGGDPWRRYWRTAQKLPVVAP